MRLQKFLASAGLGSRRHCEEYIETGRVTVDGDQVWELGTRVDPTKQKIRLDGELIRSQPKRYFLLNKPAGYICTAKDPAGRARAIDLVPPSEGRLFTVGRLDENSEGLLLITNDGELANRLAHPRYGIERIYRLQVAGNPNRETLVMLKRGIHLSEGKFRARRIRIVGSRGKSTFLEMVLTEGRNREIRRMLAHVGHKVIHLQRVGFGPLRLGRLPVGKSRPLRPVELKAMHELLSKKKTGKPHNRSKLPGQKKRSRKPSSSRR